MSATDAMSTHRRVAVRSAGHPVAGCLSAVLALCVLLAYAGPPDPSWISGIYDGGNADDVVSKMTEATGISHSPTVSGATRVMAWLLAHARTGAAQSPTGRRPAGRAPPIETRVPSDTASPPVTLHAR